MKLVQVQVTKFRNFLDSGLVDIQPDVTCLVGKNEAGKSGFLHALHRLMPAVGDPSFTVLDDYPAWLEKKDRLKGHDLEKVQPIHATFDVEAGDLKAAMMKVGPGVLTSKQITLSRTYDGGFHWNISPNEPAAVTNLLKGLTLPADAAEQAKAAKTLQALRDLSASLQSKPDLPENVQAGRAIAAKVQETYGKETVSNALWAVLKDRFPKFLYFSEYARLPYAVDIRRVLTATDKDLKEEELTARSLLRMAGATNDYLLNQNYEQRKRELQNCANLITEDVRAYWTQNPELRVDPDLTLIQHGPHAVIDKLMIRIWDNRHQLSLPFDRHSTGFRWFFSFLAAFSEFENSDAPIVILLDEPALGLHAKAQADFLRFIDERLSKGGRQVIYTTHSPFMVQPGKLERVRMVEDKGREHGTKVTANVMSTDRDTLFPLQGALGYDLVQHLFISDHNLVVEGTSDYTYLRVISDYLAEKEREALDERWSMVPVGSIDAVPTFVALLGHHLDVTVVIDAQKAGHQRLEKLAEDGFLAEQRIITIGQVLGQKFADVEDLFDPADYLALFNATFGKTYTLAELAGTDPIATRLARAMGVDRYAHGKPADRFLRKRNEILPKLSKTTLDNFEKLFKAVNATLEDEDPAPKKKLKKRAPRS